MHIDKKELLRRMGMSEEEFEIQKALGSITPEFMLKVQTKIIVDSENEAYERHHEARDGLKIND